MINALEKVIYPNGKTKAIADLIPGSVSAIIDEVHSNTSAITTINAQLSTLIGEVNTNTSAISGINTRLNNFFTNNAGQHNSIYRGKNLGTSVTASQWATIQDGTFDDLYIGDYWTINNVNWRIAAFDYWFGTGNTECTDHHVVIVPDSAIDTGSMNSTATTEGGYVGSDMYTNGLNDSKAAINSAFGSAHVLSHQELLTKTVADGKASNWGWYPSTVEIMSEAMVYGLHACSSNPAYDTGIDRTQLPLFKHRPDLITIRSNLWLRDVGSSDSFCILGQEGAAFKAGANGTFGIRPAFAIYDPTTQQSTNTRKKATVKKKGETK